MTNPNRPAEHEELRFYLRLLIAGSIVQVSALIFVVAFIVYILATS